MQITSLQSFIHFGKVTLEIKMSKGQMLMMDNRQRKLPHHKSSTFKHFMNTFLNKKVLC